MSLSPFPGWALALLALLAAAGLVLSWLPLRREARPSRRRLLFATRLLAALALLALLLEPGRRLMQTTRVKNRVAVLIDRSASMTFPEKPGAEASRADAARRFLESSRSRLSQLSERFTVELYAFDRDVEAVDGQRLAEQLAPRSGATDLAGALRQAASGGGAAAGRKLSGIVVVSDGADNAELAQGLTPRATQALEELQVPVSTVAVGASGLRDVAVERVAVDDFAFVRNTIEVAATVRISGYEGAEVPVVLKREGRVVASKVLRAQEPEARLEATFSFAPDQTGHFVYTVEAPVLAGEAVSANNARSFALKVIRDRVRVLLVVGRPSWDERFLRGLLKQDPNVDLISFFILRTNSDDPRVTSDDELSLIPFPVREIFQEQLKTFDLVVLQNFAYDDRSYQMGMYLEGMRNYIRDGGALVMIGGENSFGEGRYDRTELQAALPVEPLGLPPSTEPFVARLTPEGKRHPVAQVAPSAEASERAWAAMPELTGVHQLRARQDATVLLEHPFLSQGGQNLPVVVLGEHGRGRVMAIAADSTWLWSFGAAAGGAGGRAYDRLWNNAIRWLVRDPDLTQVRVAVEKAAVEPGEPVGVQVSARLPDYGPAAGARVEVELVDADQGRVVLKQSATAGADGTVRLELAPPGPGPYKVVARAFRGDSELGRGEDAVAVRAAGPELSDAAPRPGLLEEIAQATGGAFQRADGALAEIPLIDPETVEVGRRKDQPLWDRWELLALLGAALGADWFARRRWGYP